MVNWRPARPARLQRCQGAEYRTSVTLVRRGRICMSPPAPDAATAACMCIYNRGPNAAPETFFSTHLGKLRGLRQGPPTLGLCVPLYLYFFPWFEPFNRRRTLEDQSSRKMAINASQGVLALGVLTLLFGGDILTLLSGTGVSPQQESTAPQKDALSQGGKVHISFCTS
ncbi:hypothetical protein COCOBI_06-3320 [Coccomyxa sp. Obi]|nr:hypothetical protein COCOBI_06-3320 [Coccomyxa sp. Obi]